MVWPEGKEGECFPDTEQGMRKGTKASRAGVEGSGGKCVAGDDDSVGQRPGHGFLLAMLRSCILV